MNKALLEYKMKENGKSISDMCGMLGISRSAYYRKCNGKSEFTQSEIQKIVNYLNLDSPMDIFFCPLSVLKDTLQCKSVQARRIS